MAESSAESDALLLLDMSLAAPEPLLPEEDVPKA
jgi:hypothetical protein